MSKHYSKDALDMYRHGEMSVLARINCSSHLQQCKDCATRLAELEADEKLLTKLRSSVEIFRQLSETPSISPPSQS